MTNEVTVAVLRSDAARLSPSTTTNIHKMAESPINQEPREMQISFMSLPQGRIGRGITRIHANQKQSNVSRTSKSYPRSIGVHPRRIFSSEISFQDRFRGSILVLRGRVCASAVGAQILFSLAVIH